MSAPDLLGDMNAALIAEHDIAAAAPTMTELPVTLPVEHLSNSSVALLWKCPEKWRRRYICREYEPPSGAAIAGSCTGAAERINFEQKIQTGEDLPEADLLDAFADEWHERSADSSVDWKGETSDSIRSSAQEALTIYHRRFAPQVQPVSLERQFRLRFAGVDWSFTGYLDLEEADGAVSDLKCKGQRLSVAKADTDPQPASYMLARRAEGNPASEFRFHTMIRSRKPTAEIVVTNRTDGQLDTFLGRIFAAASEIAWRVERDVWSGAIPGEWWCSAKWCGYWTSCPMGGAR